MNAIDHTNWQLVGVQGGLIHVLAPKTTITKTEALVHAAWLVTLADDDDAFTAALDAVQST